MTSAVETGHHSPSSSSPLHQKVGSDYPGLDGPRRPLLLAFLQRLVSHQCVVSEAARHSLKSDFSISILPVSLSFISISQRLAVLTRAWSLAALTWAAASFCLHSEQLCVIADITSWRVGGAVLSFLCVSDSLTETCSYGTWLTGEIAVLSAGKTDGQGIEFDYRIAVV